MLIHLTRSPCVRVIFMDGGVLFDHRIHDSPCLLHIVLSSEQCGIACHRISDDPCIGVHVIGSRPMACHHFHCLTDHLLGCVHDCRSKSEIIRRGAAGG